MKIIFSGGGTAGHINPAIAVAQYIEKQEPGSTIHFAGGRGNLEERIVPQAGYPIFTVPLKGLSRSLSPSGLRKNIEAVRCTVSALSECKRFLKEMQPDLVMGTGGYASFPMVYAAQKLGIKTAILELNTVPGAVTRHLSRRVDLVLCSFAQTEQHLKKAKKVVWSGSPVRAEIVQCRTRAYPPVFESPRPLVASFWGSVGAYHMNKKMEHFIARAAKERQFDHIHAAGRANFAWMPDDLREMGCDMQSADNVRLLEYIDDMDRVLSQAALVICRAGGTIAELCVAGKASILVPSPYVTGDHQTQNARMMEQAGAAVLIPEIEATPERLYDTVLSLLDDPARLYEMGQCAYKMAQPHASDNIYRALRALLD